MLASKTGRTALYPGCNHEDCCNHESRTRTKYIYNAEGERVHENVGGVVEEFLNASGPQSLTLVDANQNPVETDYSFSGRPLATANSGGLYFAATDNLGTVRARFNAAGASVETDTSWPYGEFRNYANAISRLHFTGKLDDTESGLDYFGARYYNADLGRFLTPDWSASPEAVPYADVKDPQSLNLYAYVTNGPTTAIDPDGHWCIFGFGTTCTKAQKLPVKEGDGAPAWHWCQGGNAKCDKNGNVIPDSGAIYQDNGMLGLMVGGIGGFFARDAATAGAGGAVTAGVRAAARPMVSIVEVDQGVTEYSVAGANGEIRVLAEVTKEGDTLVLRGTSVQGAGSGTSSVTELRQAAREIGSQAGVSEVRIEGGIRMSGANPGRLPSAITVKVNQ